MAQWVAADAEVLFLARVKMSQNPGDAGDSPILQLPRNSLVYLSSATGTSLTSLTLKKKVG